MVSWTDQGIEYEADQRQAEIMIHQLGMSGESKSVASPGTKVALKDLEEWDGPLDAQEVAQHRALSARPF